MANTIKVKTRVDGAEPAATALAAAELGVNQIAAATTAAASGKLYYGEDVDGNGTTVARAFGIGIKTDNGTTQSGVPIGGNIYFKDGSGIDITQSTSGDVTTLTFAEGPQTVYMTSFQLEDDDGTEVTIEDAKEVKFIGSGITTNWTDTSPGSDADPFDLTFTVDAAQTGITSLLATDIKIGEDDQTKIDFETADEIHFYAANVEQVYLADNIFGPQSDSDVDLGTTGVRWKDAYVDSITVTGEVDGASLDISGDADIDGTLETDNLTVGGAQGSDGQVLTSTGSGVGWEDAAGGSGMTSFILEDDDGTEVSISDAEEVKFIGSGITTNWTDTTPGSDADPFDMTFTVDAAQTGITSLLATDIKIGEDDQTKIDFETADEIHFYAANVEQVYLADNIFGPQSDSDVDLGTTGVRWKDAYVDSITVTGEVDGASLDISGDADIDGTLEADAITIGSTAIGSIYQVLAGSSDTVTTGALDSGSITSGFGAIDVGSSAIAAGSFDASDGNITNVGDIDADSISVADAANGLDIDFSGANTAKSSITIADNLAEALVIQQGSNDYLDICTTNSSETLSIGHGVSGTAITIGHATSETTVADNLTVTGDLAVSGTTTTVAQIVGTVANAIVFEGDTSDAHESTLAITDPTADCTFTLPALSAGTFHIPMIAGTATDASAAVTAAEFALLDGGSTVGTTAVADGDGILTNDGGTMKQTTVQTFATYFADEITSMSNLTSVGTLTTLTVDDVAVNGKVITMTGSTNDTATMTVGTNGTLAITTVDTAAAAANMTLTADGAFEAIGTTVTLDSGGAINLEPASGSAILLDGTISVDAGVVTGATSITSTAFVGDITGDVTGNADTATLGTSVTVTDNAETNETVYICFVDGASGTQGIETEGKLTYNPSTTALDGVLINAGTYTAA